MSITQSPLRWYTNRDMIAEAVPHAFAAGDSEAAADLIARLAEPMLLRGEVMALVGWLRALPDAAVQARPALGMARPFALLAVGELAGVEKDILALSNSGGGPVAEGSPARSLEVGQMQARAERAPDPPAWMRDSAAAMRVLLATMQDAGPRDSSQARQDFEHQPELAPPEHQLASLNHGFAHWGQGQVGRARAAFTAALKACQRGGDRGGEVLATSFLADLHVQEGRLHQAARRYEQAARRLDQPEDRSAPVASLPAIGLGMLCYEWNELDRARQLIDQGLEHAERGGRVDVVITGLTTRAKIEQANGDIAAACAAQEQAVQAARSTHTPRLIAYAEAQQAALWLAQGQGSAAIDWARSQSMGLDDDIPYLAELEYLTFARVLIAQGAYDDALYLLDRLRAYATDAGRDGQVIPVLLAAALAHQARGDIAKACEAVRQGLVHAEVGGYLRAFVDAGPALAAALSRACDQLAREPEPKPGIGIRAYAQRVLAACQAGWPAQPTGTPASEANLAQQAPQNAHAHMANTSTEPRLSPREIDLLACLSAGMSNKEIARQLGLTTNTVRWYSSKLYDKLGVRSRTQAIARAKSMGLLR